MEHKKRYAYWYTSCKECYYYNSDEEQCDNPDAPLCLANLALGTK